MSKFNYFVYQADYKVNLSIDDPKIIEKMLYDVKSEIKGSAWNERVEECLDYCNLYIDLKMAYEELKAAKAAKEKALEKKSYTFVDTVETEDTEGKDDSL